MRIKKLRKGVDLNLKTKKSKYVIDTAPEDPKLPALFLFFVGLGVLARLMPVLPCARTLKLKCPMISLKI